MLDQRSNDEPSVLVRLLEQVIADRDAGTVRSDAEYQALFPGHERAVERELVGMRGGTVENWTIGGYRILDELASGGQGVVYLAEDPLLPRRVALKVLRGLINPPPHVFLRFRREAELLARIDHPGVCPIYAAGLSEGSPWLAMKFVEGETLERRISAERARNELPRTRAAVDERVRIVAALARAVGALHAKGVTHRDVKPRNVMLERGEHPVLLDFGIAHVEDSRLTAVGDAIGAPLYMAPEQTRGEPTHHATDVWALGVVLYECLAPQAPFHRSSTVAVIAAIQSGAFEPLGRVNSAVPKDVQTIVATALDPDPTRRYADASAMAADLEAFLEKRPIAARPAGPLLRAVRWCQRHPVRAVLTAAALLLLTVGALAVRGVLVEAEHVALERRERAHASVEEAFVELVQDGASPTRAQDLLDQAAEVLGASTEIATGRLLVCLRTLDPASAANAVAHLRGSVDAAVLDVFTAYLSERTSIANLDAQSAEQAFALGAVALLDGHVRSAEGDVASARAAYTAAVRSLELAVQLESSPPTLHRLLLLQAAQYAERHDVARAVARGLNLLVPDSAAVDLLARGDAAAAVAKSPEFAWARRVVAKGFVERGDHLAAAVHLERAARADPANAPTHLELGLAYLSFSEANPLVTKSAVIDGRDPLGAAIEALVAASSLAPDDVNASAALERAQALRERRGRAG